MFMSWFLSLTPVIIFKWQTNSQTVITMQHSPHELIYDVHFNLCQVVIIKLIK